MKKLLIGSLVGGVLLSIWQFLSFGPLQIHAKENQYTANQDAIIEALSANLEEDGDFMIPRTPPGTDGAAQQEFMVSMKGKPWAVVKYRKAFQVNFGMNVFRGFVIDFLSVLLLIWILMKIPDINFMTAVLSSLAVGAIAYMTIPYLNSIWYESPTIGYIIDWIVAWGLVGAWLGWWLKR